MGLQPLGTLLVAPELLPGLRFVPCTALRLSPLGLAPSRLAPVVILKGGFGPPFFVSEETTPDSHVPKFSGSDETRPAFTDF